MADYQVGDFLPLYFSKTKALAIFKPSAGAIDAVFDLRTLFNSGRCLRITRSVEGGKTFFHFDEDDAPVSDLDEYDKYKINEYDAPPAFTENSIVIGEGDIRDLTVNSSVFLYDVGVDDAVFFLVNNDFTLYVYTTGDVTEVPYRVCNP